MSKVAKRVSDILTLDACQRALNAIEPRYGVWVPVSERLPKESDYAGKIVVACDESNVWIDRYYVDGGWWGGVTPVAWMPLPKLPRYADDE